MNYKKINEKLKDFNLIRNGQKIESKSPDGEEYENGYEIYKLDDDIYVRLEIYEDSYGDNEAVVGIQFIKPKVVTVTEFETL